jgi:hypothetical protein
MGMSARHSAGIVIAVDAMPSPGSWSMVRCEPAPVCQHEQPRLSAAGLCASMTQAVVGEGGATQVHVGLPIGDQALVDGI